MEQQNNQNNKNVSFPLMTSQGTTIFIIFLVFKLTHILDWNWWWVTSPLWIVAGLNIIRAFVFQIFYYNRYNRF